MKKILLAIFAAMIMLMFANFAFADVDQRTTVTTGDVSNALNSSTIVSATGGNATGGNASATGGNANQQQDQNQKQKQDQNQQQKQDTTVTGVQGNVTNTTVNLPNVGFTTLLSAGNVRDDEGWETFCPAIYRNNSLKAIENMRRKFHFSDLFPWNWGRTEEAPVEGALTRTDDEKKQIISIACTCYWPYEIAASSDQVLGTKIINGDPEKDKLDEYFIGEAENYCYTEYNSSRVAMQKRVKKDGVTLGASIGGSAAAATLSGGDKGTAYIGGAMVGKTRTRSEDYPEIRVLCLNDGPTMCKGEPAKPTEITTSKKKTPPPEVEVKAPAPQAKCNPSEFSKKLKEAEDEIFICWLYGHNNLSWQLKALKESLNLWLCTNKVSYLESAIQHGQMAELNFINGEDIAGFEDSGKLISEAEYWLASAFYARDNSLDKYWKAPEYVVHIDKKTGKAKKSALTEDEKRRVEKLRSTLERYSKKLTL